MSDKPPDTMPDKSSATISRKTRQRRPFEEDNRKGKPILIDRLERMKVIVNNLLVFLFETVKVSVPLVRPFFLNELIIENHTKDFPETCWGTNSVSR